MNSLEAYLDDLRAEEEALPPSPPPPAAELIVDKRTGVVRQAGADAPGAFVTDFKLAAEKSLYTFTVGVLGRTYLTRTLHEPVCDWLTDLSRKRRKMLLMPREHCKTTIVGHGLPLHMMIQPKDNNIYLPGQDGRDTTIVFCGETEDRVTDAMRVIQGALEGNSILRGLWPHVCWDNPRAESKKWNETEMIIRRPTDYPDPTIRGVGVGAAIAGAHPRVLIKDDIATYEASTSSVVMQAAIKWHVASRGLINKPECLEFMMTTRWAPYDWARFVMEEDDSVESMVRAGIEAGVPIYPEAGFTLEKFAALRKEFGSLFPFLYLNTAVGADITDFDMADVRQFAIHGNALVFTEDDRDLALAERAKPKPRESSPSPMGESEYPGGRAAIARLRRG